MQQQASLYDWVRAAGSGDTGSANAAWSSLHKLLYPAVYAHVLRLVKEPAFAKDVVQDTFVTAYGKLHQLKEPAAIEGWIKTIATRFCYKILHRFRPYDVSLPHETDSWWEDTISHQFELLHTQGRLYTALSQLSESLQSTLLLRYFSDYSAYDQIAAILGIPVGSVRSRLNQAKIKLTEYWHQQPGASEQAFTANEEWNAYYHLLYGSMHANDVYKNRFIQHLEKHVRIHHVSGQTFTGSQLMEGIVAEDRQAGSSLSPVHIISSGHITIIESKHFNSTAFPGHCPAESVTVLYRNKGKVDRMTMHPVGLKPGEI